jgi:hypothetical protein
MRTAVMVLQHGADSHRKYGGKSPWSWPGTPPLISTTNALV